MSTNHNPVQLLCLLINIIFVAATTLVAFTALARQYDFQEAIPKLLRHDLQEIAEKNPTPISPASWLHCLWAAILIWQVVWSLHGLFSICRKTAGVPVYTSPELLTSIYLLLFDFACGCNIAWFILYDRGYTATSCLFIAVTALTVWIAYTLSLHALGSNLFRLEKSERHSEIWVTRILVHNGLALYAMWCVFMAAFNLTLALIHNSDTQVNDDTSSVVGMSIMGFVQLTYLSIDVICLDRWSRYVMTPYIIPVVVLAACLFRQDDWISDDVNFIFLTTLLCFAFVALMLKSACTAFRIMKSTSGGGEITMDRSRPSSSDEAHYLLK